jgi:hypothetical protein
MKFGLNNYSSKGKERFLPNVYVTIDLFHFLEKQTFSNSSYRDQKMAKNGRMSTNFNKIYRRNKTWMNKNKEQYNDWQKTYFKGLETKYNKLGGIFYKF